MGQIPGFLDQMGVNLTTALARTEFQTSIDSSSVTKIIES